MFPLNPKLTISQEVVLQENENLIVSGPAGSGKTYLTIALSKKILQESPNATIQIIVFTKSLSAFIIKGLQVNGIKKVNVDHYARWKFNKRQTDYVIVDEVQDLTLKNLEEINSYSTNRIYFLGDSNQSIYTDNLQGCTINDIIVQFGFKHIELKEIVRFNLGIKNFVSESFDYLNNAKILNINKELPRIIYCENESDELDKLIELLSKRDKGKSIAILVFQNSFVQKILNDFQKHNVKIDGYKYYTEVNLSLSPGSVNVLTYHSAKGLDFDIVILPFLDLGNGFNKNVYYVGFTRAKEELYLMYKKNFPFDLRFYNQNVYEGEITSFRVWRMIEHQIEMYKIQSSVYNLPHLSIAVKMESERELEEIRQSIRGCLKKISWNEERIAMWLNQKL